MKTPPVSRAHCYVTPLTVLFGTRPQYKHSLNSVHNIQSYLFIAVSFFFSSLYPSLYSVACWCCLQLTPSSSVLLFLHPPSRDFSLIFFFFSLGRSSLSLYFTLYIVTFFPFFSLHARSVTFDYCLKVLLTLVGKKHKKKPT